MQSPFSENGHSLRFSFKWARRLLTSALVLSLVVFTAIVVDLQLRAHHQDETAQAWMHALTLSAPVLWTAGTPRRYPEMTHPGVALNHSPVVEAVP